MLNPGVRFDTVLRGLRTGSPRTGWGGLRAALRRTQSRLDAGMAEGWLPGSGRLQTGPYTRKGCGRPGIGWEGWVRLAVWFDTGLRKTPARLTTNGVGRALRAVLRRAQGRLDAGMAEGWLRGRGRLETGPYTRKGCGRRRTGWEGWVRLAVWFDTGLRWTPARLTTNGVGQAHHERRAGWFRGRVGIPGGPSGLRRPRFGSEPRGRRRR